MSAQYYVVVMHSVRGNDSCAGSFRLSLAGSDSHEYCRRSLPRVADLLVFAVGLSIAPK